MLIFGHSSFERRAQSRTEREFLSSFCQFFLKPRIYLQKLAPLPLRQLLELTVSIFSYTACLMLSKTIFMCPTERINRLFMIKMSTQMAWTYRQRTVIKSSQLRFSRFSIKSCSLSLELCLKLEEGRRSWSDSFGILSSHCFEQELAVTWDFPKWIQLCPAWPFLGSPFNTCISFNTHLPNLWGKFISWISDHLS